MKLAQTKKQVLNRLSPEGRKMADRLSEKHPNLWTGILIGDAGAVRFTKAEKPRYTEHFAKAGIDINTIKTYEQLHHAWTICKPFFYEFLGYHSMRRAQSTENDLLLATLFGDEKEAAKLERQLQFEKLNTPK